MVDSVRRPALVAAGFFLATFLTGVSSAGFAQSTSIKVQVSGPGSQGAYVDLAPLGYGDDALELETGSAGNVTAGGAGSDVTLREPLQPGIYEVWVEGGSKNAGGLYEGGSTYVYVGKDGATVNFDLTGRPPVEPSGNQVFQIGQRAKEACNIVTYHRAVNQLTLYVAEIDKAMADLQRAIDAYLRDGAMESVPEPYRTRMAGIILAGGTPREMAGDISKIRSDMKQEPNPLDGLNRAYSRLAGLAAERALYVDYLAKLRPPPECPKRTAMYQDALKPILVGAKGAVGCDAKLKQDVVSTLGGGGLGALGGGGRSFGLGGGGASSRTTPARPSSSSNEPKLSPDPVPMEMKRHFTGANNTAINFGTMFTDQGLWVSSNIDRAPCQGSFQTVYLRDPQTGEKAGPTGYVLTELYLNWKLTVNWTYDRWVNNQHVEHKEGGWKDSGREFLGSWTEPSNGKGVWNDLGWGTAVAGAKGMGFFFPITYADFAKKPLDIVIHVANPDTDPVSTTGFGFETVPVMRDPGGFGRAPRALPKAKSQQSPPEMTWKTPFTADMRF